MKCEQQI